MPIVTRDTFRTILSPMLVPPMLVPLILVIGLAGALPDLRAADWPTHRGNSQRTGNIDGQPGPVAGKVLWVHKSNDHYVASPVCDGTALFVSGLAAFNTSTFQALSVEPAAKQRVKWAKSVPYLKLPTVCAPAIAGGLAVFGDGMHQTDGAVLHGVRADSGLPLWQLPVPGQLVHLEGSPTISGGKVFIGGGNAGVLCVDPSRLELDGKDVDAVAAQAMLDKKWKELLAKYEQEKKVDPDFAIPPSEDALPKPRPKIVWQAGSGKWHVDAPIGVTGDRVLVATAFLDAEKVGERALYCLKAGDGGVIWKTPLEFNPWSGPTLAGDLVLVGTSSVRLEPNDVAKARGEVAAVSTTDGAVKWRHAVSGGVISPLAVKGNLAVCTATDGKVRAWDTVSGQEKWMFSGKSPFFAGPAIAGDVVYVADLKGIVQAINLVDGKQLWSVDLATDPAVTAPGMVYGSPVVAGGRLYVATCNLDYPPQASKTAVVCLGDR